MTEVTRRVTKTAAVCERAAGSAVVMQEEPKKLRAAKSDINAPPLKNNEGEEILLSPEDNKTRALSGSCSKQPSNMSSNNDTTQQVKPRSGQMVNEPDTVVPAANAGSSMRLGTQEVDLGGGYTKGTKKPVPTEVIEIKDQDDTDTTFEEPVARKIQPSKLFQLLFKRVDVQGNIHRVAVIIGSGTLTMESTLRDAMWEAKGHDDAVRTSVHAL